MSTEREDQAAVMAAIAERFQRDGTGKRVQTTTAVLLRNGESLQPDLAALAPQLRRETLFAIALDDCLVQLLLGEPDNVFTQALLLFSEREIHQSISFSR